jgi:hypothetical protein
VLRTLAVAAVTLVLIGGAGWGLQAVSLDRPSRAELELVKTLHALTAFRGSRASLDVDGWRYRTLCVQHWYPDARVARVFLDPRNGRPRVGKLPLDGATLELAGCPRPLAGWLASALIHGASVHMRRFATHGTVLREIEIRPRKIPINVYVSRSTSLPVRLRLSVTGLRASSIVHYSELR